MASLLSLSVAKGSVDHQFVVQQSQEIGVGGASDVRLHPQQQQLSDPCWTVSTLGLRLGAGGHRMWTGTAERERNSMSEQNFTHIQCNVTALQVNRVCVCVCK